MNPLFFVFTLSCLAVGNRPSFDKNMARAFASFAQAGYCGHNESTKEMLLDWTCGDSCREAGISIVPGTMRFIEHREILEKTATFMYAVRIVQNMTPACVVGYRGSATLANWIHDFDTTKVMTGDGGMCPGCYVSHGFWTIVVNSMPALLGNMSEIGCRPGGETDKVYVAGHSLGAALAQLAMFAFRTKGFDVLGSYHFESPRVGNRAFADHFDHFFSQAVPTFRVTHGKDLFVQVPFRRHPWNFEHTNYEVYINLAGHIDECREREDPRCSDQWHFAQLLCPLWRPWMSLFSAWLNECIQYLSVKHCKNPLADTGNLCTCAALVQRERHDLVI